MSYHPYRHRPHQRADVVAADGDGGEGDDERDAPGGEGEQREGESDGHDDAGPSSPQPRRCCCRPYSPTHRRRRSATRIPSTRMMIASVPLHLTRVSFWPLPFRLRASFATLFVDFETRPGVCIEVAEGERE